MALSGSHRLCISPGTELKIPLPKLPIREKRRSPQAFFFNLKKKSVLFFPQSSGQRSIITAYYEWGAPCSPMDPCMEGCVPVREAWGGALEVIGS